MQNPVLEAFPLSPQQAHLWALQQSNGCAPLRTQCAVMIEGRLNPSALKDAIDKVLADHEILRTIFRQLPEPDEPAQLITTHAPIRIEERDFSEFGPLEQVTLVDSLFEEIRLNKLNIAEAPPLGLSLMTLSISRYVLLISLPSLCADASTLDNLVREISRNYEGVSAAEQPAESPQYVDLAAWLSDLLESEDTEAGRAYWRAREIGNLDETKLPLQRVTVGKASGETKLSYFEIDEDVSAGIEALAQAHKTLVQDLLLASWQVLLWRLTGQSEFVIGVAYDGRNYEELRQALGPFTRYLPLGCELYDELSFVDLLNEVSRTTREMSDWQQYFSYRLLKNTSEHPDNLLFYSYGFGYENLSAVHQAAEVTFSIFKQFVYGDRFKLKLTVARQTKGMQAEIQYDAGLFERDDIEQLAGHYQVLLRRIVAQPDKAVGRLQLLSADEQRKLLGEGNGTTGSYPASSCLHELFEAQAARTPAAIALTFGEQQLTYDELNACANRLAHSLRELGVRPDTLVGICVERSPLMVAGILGTLKAGGAYVPLDPDNPQERLSYIVHDAGVSVLLTEAALATKFSESACRVLCLDTDASLLSSSSTANPTNLAHPENLCYVIYTSGSTGRPKGVLVTHANVARLFSATESFYQFNEHDVWTMFHSYAFDFSVWELWGALLYGGRLVIVPYLVSRSPDVFYKLLGTEKVTVLNQTPSAFRQLMQTETNDQPAEQLSLRWIVFGGEALELQSLRLWFERHGDKQPQLVNMYGITETTVHVTQYAVTSEDLNGGTGSLIGRAIADLQTYILDRCLQPVPVGVTGELYIGGDGLARGYLHRPELTGERFVPNPYASLAGKRLYKTGDLARHLPDGNIEYLGRADHQVKIRGFRIELGEIEAVIGSHPAVRVSAVTIPEVPEAARSQQLAAYVVVADGATLSQTELKAYVRERLPEYMVPSLFQFIAELPLTANGKVDRSALPAPTPDTRTPDQEYLAARTPIEEMLSSIFAEVLGLTQVSINDNFFELGGHSLLATQLISRVREAFSIELLLRSVFESPTVAELSRQVEAEIRMDRGLETPPIKPVARNTELPLSFAQERIWFLDQLESDSPLYHLPMALQFKGQVNVPALEKTFNEIVRRHEVLRTNFRSLKGKPVQVIASPETNSLPVVDLSDLPEAERLRAARRIATEEALTLFDLSRDPLLRVKLVRLDAETFVVLLTTHHIVCDGWSLGLLTDEVTTLYRAYCAGEPASLPELPVQYADYAVWQRELLTGPRLQQHLDYWRSQLGYKPPVIALPIDHPRPPVQSHRGARHVFVLPTALTESLKSLSHREGVTLYISLLAAFNALLHRYTGQTDIVVGTDIANRNRAETEHLIGTFVNHLALRTDLSGEPTFRELLRRVREVCLGAYAHQDLPFERLIEELQPDRDWSRFPIFQVKCVLQNMPAGNLDLPAVELSRKSDRQIATDSESTMLFDLSLSLTESAHGLMAVLEYNTDIFEPPTVARLAAHYQQALESVAANPEQQLWELSLLAPAESHELLEDWNQTAAEYPRSECIHQLFEAQVLRAPESIAVEFEDQQLSYHELNGSANQLAHYLRSLGVGAETLVGICLPRSSEMIVGLLAILKAGGAYVPLDAAYPKERLAFMVEDANISVLLTHGDLVEKLPVAVPLTICVDRDKSAIEQRNTENPSNQATPDNLAYVIYTSGSTGRPKGVQISHRALANFQCAMRRRPGVTAQDKLVAVTTLSFDIAGFEIYPTLCSGACIRVVSRAEASDGKRLAARLKEPGITILQATPASWQLLLAGGWRNDTGLKMICGGEALPQKMSHQLLAGNGPLWNVYGPTESTIWSSAYHFEAADSPIMIGRPIDNTSFYILDDHLQAVPVGVTGELYIGGVGLARGYLNRPDLTADRFIPNPYAAEAGERLYKTGDLCRYRLEGNVEYLGRADNQIKIRGFRIELGEIESVLESHSTIRECVVAASSETNGDRRLVAYVVHQPNAVSSADELRGYLKERLPDYMVPSIFILLEKLPLTPNGKVDRRALPAPEVGERALETNYVEPQSPIEEVLCAVWSELLGVERVGINDNFFDLGGHSLLATQLISRVTESFAVELPLRTIFDLPTVRELAVKIDQARLESSGLLMPPVKPIPRDTELPTSFLQDRRLKRYQEEIDNSAPEAAANCCLNYLISGSLDLPVLERSLNEVIRRHETLRSYFILKSEAQPVQKIAPSLKLNVQTIDLRQQPPAERQAAARRIVREENSRRFDLTKPPLLRAVLLRMGEEQQIFVLALDHVIFDGQSSDILLNELMVLYQAFATGSPSPLPELPAQYVDYAHWQRTQFHPERIEAYLAYWKQQLDQENPFPELLLPFARPVSENSAGRGAKQELVLSTELAEALRNLSRQKGVTMFMTLLTVLKLLLLLNTNRTNAGVLTPAANRLREETHNLIGFFANVVILNTDFSGDPSFSEALARVRESCLGAFERQDLPLSKVLEGLGNSGEKITAPSVWFDYAKSSQGTVRQDLPLASLKVSPISVHSDLTAGAFNVHVMDQSATISIGIEYEMERFADEDIARMLKDYHRLLENVVIDAERPISELLRAGSESAPVELEMDQGVAANF